MQDQAGGQLGGLGGQGGTLIKVRFSIVFHIFCEHTAARGPVGRAKGFMQLSGHESHLIAAAIRILLPQEQA